MVLSFRYVVSFVSDYNCGAFIGLVNDNVIVFA